ncbi:MAG: cytochrome c biogenesis protein CcsA [Planctomycetota bacterium]
MNLANWTSWSTMHASARWSAICDLLCVAGVLVALLACVVHWRASQSGEATRGFGALVTRSKLLLTAAAFVAMLFSVSWRAVEVNHFPSQTMSEVLNMFATALIASMLVLHFALGMQRRGPGWAILDDVLVALTLGGVFFTHIYIQTLTTAQRDLPPALQSYWFAPHLVSLIFSYATMGIAAFVAIAYFTTRFWCGLFQGGFSKGSQWLIFAGLALVPFVQVVTLPILALSGVVFFVLLRMRRLPTSDQLRALERELDDVSFRAFAVGIPFLTAGLWMGAFWAQEAWANYWGWDSKENSALITWLVYIIYIHLRLLGGYRGAKAMSVLVGGALSVFLTFQIFGYLPDSQKSLHRYTDDGVRPMEGQQGGMPVDDKQVRADVPADER